MTELPVPWFQWLHTHGHLVGFSYRKRFVCPHKPSVVMSRYCVSVRLFRRAERLAHCPGGVVCSERHHLEHRAYLVRKGRV